MSDTAATPGPLPDASPPGASLADVGILFIHGIGSQQRGETLLKFGEPIYSTLGVWAERHHRQLAKCINRCDLVSWYNRIAAEWESRGEGVHVIERFETIRALLELTGESDKPDGPDDLNFKGPVAFRIGLNAARIRDETNDDVPSHARLKMRWVETSGTTPEREWLLAESWWAERFYPPRYRDLVKWGLEGLCWTVGSHFAARVRRTFYEMWNASSVLSRLGAGTRFLTSLVYLLIGLLISGLGFVALLMVLLLALWPSRKVRAAVAGLQQRLAASIGDSYMLLASPMTSASIVSQVQRDYDWLAASCRSVVIVAHSQGAAIAYLLLRQRVPERLKVLVTFGSGLRKLEELRQIQRPDAAAQARQTTAGILVMLTVALAVLVGWSRLGGWTIVALIWSVIAALSSVYFMAKGHASPELKWWTGIFKSLDVKWLDFYASADPVPNGPLWHEADGKDLIPNSEEVHNDASILGDHTTYWDNRDEFVSKVVAGIAAAVDPTLTEFFNQGEQDREIAYARRRWRVAWLSAARRLWLALAVLLVGTRLDSWSTLLSASSLTNLTSYASALVRDCLVAWGFSGTVAWFASYSQAWVDETPKCGSIVGFMNVAGPDLPSQCVQIVAFRIAAVPLVMLAGAWLVVRGLWRLWEWEDREAFRRGSGYDNFTLASFFFALMLAFVSWGALALSLRPVFDQLSNIGLAVVTAAIILSVGGLPACLYLGSKRRSRVAAEKAGTSSQPA